jgi:adenine-specific DNA methylase
MEFSDWQTAFRQSLGGYQGTKVLLADWIADEVLPRCGEGYILDVCSGLGSMSYRFKLAERSVCSIDTQLYPYFSCLSVIENGSVRLSKEGIEWLIHANEGRHDDFVEKTFAGKYLPTFILRALDRIRYNIRVADESKCMSQATRAIALASLGTRMCVRKKTRHIHHTHSCCQAKVGG